MITDTHLKPSIGQEINFGHPLARNLTFAVLFNENGGKIITDLVNNYHGIFSDINVKWVTRPPSKLFGGGIALNKTSTLINAVTFPAQSSRAWTNGNPWTIHILAKTAILSSSAQYQFVTKHINSGDSVRVGFNNSGGALSLVYASNVDSVLSNTGKVTDSEIIFYTIRANSQTSIDFFFNGVFDKNSAPSAKGNVNTNLKILGEANNTGFKGDCYLIYIYGVAQSNQEIFELSKDPYSIFVVREEFFAPAVSTPAPQQNAVLFGCNF